MARTDTISSNLVRIVSRCGLWSCPHCRVINSFIHAQNVKAGIRSLPNQEAWFITLTLGGNIKTAQLGYALLPSLWKRYVDKMNYRSPGWQWCCFVEGHPKRNGIPHLHIIASTKPEQRLNDFARSCGFGFKTSASLVTGEAGAAYVAKYTTKADTFVPRHFRRVRYSQNWTRSLPPDMGKMFTLGKDQRLDDFLMGVALQSHHTFDEVLKAWIA